MANKPTKESYVPLTITKARRDGSKEVYQLHEELGHGGFATVYRVTRQGTNLEYAMKVIPISTGHLPIGKR